MPTNTLLTAKQRREAVLFTHLPLTDKGDPHALTDLQVVQQKVWPGCIVLSEGVYKPHERAAHAFVDSVEDFQHLLVKPVYKVYT